MRVWSFQNKDSMTVLQDSVWNRFDFQEHNTRPEDIQYARHVKVRNSQGDIVPAKRLPVYGYAKMKSDSEHILGLRTFLQQYEYLFNIYEQSLLNKIMFELDVPEESIILLRSLGDEESVVFKDYLEHIRFADSETVCEVLLPELRREWIASYHVFSAMHQHDGVIVSSDIVNNNLSAMFTGCVYMVDNKKVYYTDDVGNVVSSNAFTIDNLVGSVGPLSCPEYFTIAEAFKYCHDKYKKDLIKLCKKFGIFESKYDSITIRDLNNKKETSSNMAELFGYMEGNK